MQSDETLEVDLGSTYGAQNNNNGYLSLDALIYDNKLGTTRYKAEANPD
jgi:hypothetical protein